MSDSTALTYEPISLGSACEAKFQICRKLYSGYYGKTSEAGFRIQLLPPERGSRQYGWHAFDWQRTPFSALIAYLERDFEGVFEREDLYVTGDFIVHRTLKTEHSHQFDGFTENWTDAELDRAYPAIAQKFKRRAAEFRERLTRPGPYLYVWTSSPHYEDTDVLPAPDQLRRLIELLGARSPDHRFHLLMVGAKDKDADYSDLEDKVSKAYRTDDTGKSLVMNWEGNDARWEAILRLTP